MLPLEINCSQFKLFQDNSLMSNRSTEIHARFLQQNNDKPEIRFVQWMMPSSNRSNPDLPDCDLLSRPFGAPTQYPKSRIKD